MVRSKNSLTDHIVTKVLNMKDKKDGSVEISISHTKQLLTRRRPHIHQGNRAYNPWAATQRAEVREHASAVTPSSEQQALPNAEKPPRFSPGDDVLLSMKDISAHSGLSDKYFYSLIKRGMFPRPMKLGRASRWRKSDYEQWLNEREERRNES